MVVDDIVVVGATPAVHDRLHRLRPGRARSGSPRSSTASRGPARRRAPPWSAARPRSTPDLIAPDDYDVAGAAVGAVEADAPARRATASADGDVVLALALLGSAQQRLLAGAPHPPRRAGCGCDTPARGLGTHARRGAARAHPAVHRAGCSTCSIRRTATRCTRSATSPAAASQRTSRGCCRPARVGRPRSLDLEHRSPVFRCSRSSGGFPLSDVGGHLEPRHRDARRGRSGSAADAIAAALTAGGIDTWRAGAVRFGTASRDGVRAGREGRRRRCRASRRELRRLTRAARTAAMDRPPGPRLGRSGQRCRRVSGATSSPAKSSSDQPACGSAEWVDELLLERVVVRVRAEVLQIAGDLRVLRLLTASPHA